MADLDNNGRCSPAQVADASHAQPRPQPPLDDHNASPSLPHLDQTASPARTKRISWHSSANVSPSTSRLNLPGTAAMPDRADGNRAVSAESSGDEHTAIVHRERGRKKGHGYKTQQPGSGLRQRGPAASPAADTPEQAPHDDAPDGVRAWWKGVREKYGTMELENKGSVARDHLALERTFLAWLRTSLSFASIGVAVTQLFRLNTSLEKEGSRPAHLHHVGKPLGATFLGIGVLVLFIGFHRYFESQHYVILGKFPASRGSVFLVTVVAALLIVASLVVILTIKPSAQT